MDRLICRPVSLHRNTAAGWNCLSECLSPSAIAGAFIITGAVSCFAANDVAIEVLKLSYEGVVLEGSAIQGGRSIAYSRAGIARLLSDNKVADDTTRQFFTVEIAEGRIVNTIAVGGTFTVCAEKQKKLCMTARRLK